jgi:hypothetical protein
MGCNSKNLSKKKIIILVSIIAATAVILYYSFTINSAITLAVLPFVLPFLGCIIMCGVMVGAMFLAGRFSKKSDKPHSSCGMDESTEIRESATKPEIDTNNKKNYR